MRRRQRVTIWEGADGKREFWPLDEFVARWRILLPAGAHLVSDEMRGIMVDEGDKTIRDADDVLRYAQDSAFGYTVVEGWEEDGPKPPDFPPPLPISPLDCKHRGAIPVQSETGGPPHRSHGVTVCPRCGRFTVAGDDEGHRFRVEFELATPEAVRAAGRYCHYLSLEG